jgi:hypothetical protein
MWRTSRCSCPDALTPGKGAAATAADNAELQWLRERLRSPRHRIADRLANALQKIPVVWPLVAKRDGAGAAPGTPGSATIMALP